MSTELAFPFPRITLDIAHEPAPETEVDHPEFPTIETGHVAAILRRLIAKALQAKEIEQQDAVELCRFIDAA